MHEPEPIALPEVSAVGVLSYPPGHGPRHVGAALRGAAALILLVFVAVVVGTSAISLGRYCLTSHTSDNSSLPERFSSGRGGG